MNWMVINMAKSISNLHEAYVFVCLSFQSVLGMSDVFSALLCEPQIYKIIQPEFLGFSLRFQYHSSHMKWKLYFHLKVYCTLTCFHTDLCCRACCFMGGHCLSFSWNTGWFLRRQNNTLISLSLCETVIVGWLQKNAECSVQNRYNYEKTIVQLESSVLSIKLFPRDRPTNFIWCIRLYEIPPMISILQMYGLYGNKSLKELFWVNFTLF